MVKINLFTSNSKNKEITRLCQKLFWLLPLVFLIIGIDISPALITAYNDHILKHITNEALIAQELENGKNVELFGNIREELLHKNLIDHQCVIPDIVILGSSRSLQIGEASFPNKRVLNHSISGAKLEDYLGLFFCYEKRGVYPKEIILLLDPQLIIPFNNDNWLSIKENTYAMLNQLKISPKIIPSPLIPGFVSNIFSLKYFQKTFAKLFIDTNKELYRTTNNKVSDYELILSNGEHLWSKSTRSISVRNAKQKAIQDFYNKKCNIIRDAPPNNNLKYTLDRFIQHLKNKNINITLYFVPFHPFIYQKLIERQRSQNLTSIIDLEKNYSDLARKHDLKIIGSYDPAVVGLDENDFLDGEHIRAEAHERILSQGLANTFPRYKVTNQP